MQTERFFGDIDTPDESANSAEVLIRCLEKENGGAEKHVGIIVAHNDAYAAQAVLQRRGSTLPQGCIDALKQCASSQFPEWATHKNGSISG
jgi:hypothetical protein